MASFDQGVSPLNSNCKSALQHHHFLSGRLALTPDERFITLSNLYDGFDLYNLRDRAWVRTFRVDTQLNVPLPALVVEDGRRLFTGTSCGQVILFDLHTGVETEQLSHDGTGYLPSIQHMAHTDFVK